MGHQKIEQEVQELLKAAERNDMKPIWGYQEKLRYNPQQNQRHTSLKNEDVPYTQNTKQTLQRWTQWITKQFQTPPEQEPPEIDHITEKEWGK